MTLIILLPSVWVVVAFWIIHRGISADVDNKAFFVIGPFLFILIVYFFYISKQAEKEFWRQFAKGKDFTYSPNGDISREKALMFNRGTNKSSSHFVQGTYEGVSMRIFNYHFQVGIGKSAEHHDYVVFEFTLHGSFPHLYLNRIDSGYGFVTGEKIPLPREFEKRFNLHAPKEYEIEALEIFTPDLLSVLFDDNLRHDIEIVDGELLVFREGHIRDTAALEHEFEGALRWYKHFAAKLNAARFTQIGDRTAYLKT